MVVRELDYSDAQIRMHADTWDEQTKRIVSSAKEPETIAWIESLPLDAVLYDVGANTGSYSFVAASRGLRVVAFEPSAPNYSRLIQNCALNPDLHILALPFLLTWKTGMTFFGYSSLEPGAALHVTGKGNGGFTQAQVGWALDDLVLHTEIALPVPTHIKIDVDGHEVSVLKGAQNTLGRVRGLLVEIDDSLQDSLLIEGILGCWGFEVVSRHRHGSSSIVNTIFERR